MEIVKKKISELKKYEKNSKLHPEWQIEQIVKSIEEFGFNDPIAVDEKGIIIEGHGRLEALKKLGYEEVECIELKHLTAAQKKAYIIAHNKINVNTGFDIDMLKSEFEELKEFDFDLDLTGFTDFDVDDVFEEDIETTDRFELPSGAKEPFQTMTFTLADSQADFIKEIFKNFDEPILETFGNDNSNGNILYSVVRKWAEQKK